MEKQRLTIAEIEGLSAVELPERNLYAVAIGAGGLVGIAAAIDRIEVDIPVTVEGNNICVNAVQVAAAAACDQQQ